MITTILHLDASAQDVTRSISRQLSRDFVTALTGRLPDTRLIRRDLATDPVPFVTSQWIAAAFTPPEDRSPEMRQVLAVSDRLIGEVSAADVLVIGTPMYNYGMPAVLKAWIDQIARVGRTFSFDLARGDQPIKPILSGKRLVVLSSSGEFGFAPGGVRSHLNALDPAIEACAHYLGARADDILRIRIEYQEFKDERFASSKTQAQARALELAEQLAVDLRVMADRALI